MGNLDEAATLFVKACRLTPEARGWTVWLIATFGLLGREKEAHLVLDTYKKRMGFEPYLPNVMDNCPFKDRSVADRFAEGLIKGGIKGKPSGYWPAFKENKLTGEEIKRLLFGAKTTGIDLWDGQQWWIDRKKNGEFTWRGSGQISSDTGMSRIEGDMICAKFQKRLWRVEFCATVFRNPRGTYDRKDEHFLCTDIGFSPFPLVK